MLELTTLKPYPKTLTRKDIIIHQQEKRIKELEKELEAERKLNAEIKARFVKCNTCTPDMKEKCLMFNENLCEGERCEELVDLMALVNKRDTEDKLNKAVDIIKGLLELGSIGDGDYTYVEQAEQFLKEVEQNV